MLYRPVEVLAAPKLSGIPPAQDSADMARPGVPAVQRIPGSFSKTHASQIVWPAETATGLCRLIVCQPAVPLIGVEFVTPSRAPGTPPASAYTARIAWPVPPWW